MCGYPILRKRAGNTTLVTTQPYQGLSADFLFSCTKSKDTEWRKEYVGINNATSAIVVLDHFTCNLTGEARIYKALPIKWLKDFLRTHLPSCSSKYVHMEQGRELCGNPIICKLFELNGLKSTLLEQMLLHHLNVETGVHALFKLSS